LREDKKELHIRMASFAKSVAGYTTSAKSGSTGETSPNEQQHRGLAPEHQWIVIAESSGGSDLSTGCCQLWKFDKPAATRGDIW
jgi:hypothetical protein